MDFNAYLVGGVPLVLVVWGLVAFVKSLGVAGRALQIVGLLIGLVLGVAYQVAQAVSVDFAGWFTALIFGLALGLVANGLWDVAKFDLLPKIGLGAQPAADLGRTFLPSLPRRGCFD